MTWLDQNIDAYRIVSEILGDLRRAVRTGLESAFGESWYRDGLPEPVFDRLVAAKEREKSIDWYEGQYQQIMDYAIFADLVEILEVNAELFPELMALAPNTALLQARFIELDVMRAKLGRARPISETELSFLGTFHLRFRKAIAEMPVPEVPPTEETQAENEPTTPPTPRRRATDKLPEQEPVKPPPEVSTSPTAPPEPDPAPPAEELKPESEPESEPKSEPEAEPQPEPEPSPPPPPRKAEVVIERVPDPPPQEETTDRVEEDEAEAPKRPPTRRAQSSPVSPVPESEEPPPDSTESDVEIDDDEKNGDHDISAEKAVGPKKLADALENDDHRTVLRELYREVTTIAEGVWTSDVTPAPLVWEQVTASAWYENNFSRLGLQALSVFYEVTDKVEEMAREGSSKKELQEFLKDSNFAKTLLALRDMFQANNL